MKEITDFDVVVIGGGFYGCMTALLLKDIFQRVTIVEKEDQLLSKASYINQARVHNGYHYPRSYTTALRSHLNFRKFNKEFKSCVADQYQSVYAIAKLNSKVSANQFTKLSHQINLPIKQASKQISALFNPNLVEDIFEVKEAIFDATKLREELHKRLYKSKINILFKSKVVSVEKKGEKINVTLASSKVLTSTYVFNCTYSEINTILDKSDLRLLPFKYELAELALIELPAELKKLAITVVDGPFFSILPFPSKSLHTLSHVRYTPHYSWVYSDKANPKYRKLNLVKSNYPHMIRDAVRYIPSLAMSEHRSSLFEVKTILVENEIDDGRPILFRKDYNIEKFSVIMGGKIDNVYDILDILEKNYKR